MRISKGAIARANKKPMKPQKGAFKRALAVFKLRGEALAAAAVMGPVEMKLALIALAEKLGEYKSRGHGRGGVQPSHKPARSKYKPHQGQREMERRRVGGFAFVRWCEQRYGAKSSMFFKEAA